LGTIICTKFQIPGTNSPLFIAINHPDYGGSKHL
jgi:hypothetical protein